MIISFLRYKNFLSTGNNWIEIDFMKVPKTVVVGVNGAGKSTMLDALSYAFYKKPYRDKIVLADLINTTTNKGCLVEVEFFQHGCEYLVRRGQKPGVFEINKRDGETWKLIDQGKDYQEFLEGLIGMGHKSFRQIVGLAKVDYIPFLRLDAAGRRAVSDDMMDLQIYSHMNTLLKERVRSSKEEMIEATNGFNNIAAQIQVHEAHLAGQRAGNEEDIARKEQQIEEWAAEAMDLLAKAKGFETSIADHQAIVVNAETTQHERDKWRESVRSIQQQLRVFDTDIAFLSAHDDCPKCHQSISAKYKQEFIIRLKGEQRSLTINLDAANKHLTQYEEQVNNHLITFTTINTIQRALDATKHEVNFRKSKIRQMQTSIEELKVKVEVDGADIGARLDDQLIEATERRENAENASQVLNAASVLLKDGGIKARVIAKYMPILNKLINRHLAVLDFCIDLTLDENFNETISSVSRDKFSYGMFSEGEKMRIDLAIMFAWRELAKMRTRASSNLLVFDETCDSSLDADGVDMLLKLAGDLTKTNVFVISHRGDSLVDRFDRTLKFAKEQEFAQISEM